MNTKNKTVKGQKSTAVILTNMGGARSADELKLFLKNMFSDKRIISSPLRYLLAPIISNLRYKKVWNEYETINGSPIYKITEQLTRKLQERRNETVLFSMRYTRPYLDEIIHQFDEIILAPLYPHYSTTTVESSLDELKKTKYKGKVKIVKPFYLSEAYNQIIIDNIRKKVTNPSEWNLIFSAHGLPQKVIDKGDVYQAQVTEQVAFLKQQLSDFASVKLAYQSRVGPVKWLKPYLEDSIQKYQGQKVLIYPLSFVIDNSETLLELSILYKKVAEQMGVQQYEVVSCPNGSDEFVKFLSELADNS